MKAEARFAELSDSFWSAARLISQKFGYSEKGADRISSPNIAAVDEMFVALSLKLGQEVSTSFGIFRLPELVAQYLDFRAEILNNDVRNNLMRVDDAKRVFETMRHKLNPRCPLPMNKQKGAKKAPAYFAGIINMLIEENLLGAACNYEPRELSYFTDQGVPALTMSRRVDGAFPSAINPVAIWEVKEYYYTTTFGSRVADGVYETMLDGFEINLLSRRMRIRRPKHYLMVDDYFTWWNCGKSYLCRIIDMLHMGLVDEVLFGRQVVKRLPQIVKGWMDHEGLSE